LFLAALAALKKVTVEKTEKKSRHGGRSRRADTNKIIWPPVEMWQACRFSRQQGRCRKRQAKPKKFANEVGKNLGFP
jgi:hypothetical protein